MVPITHIRLFCYLFAKAKKRKKYTGVFGWFLRLITKKRAPLQPVDRIGARKCLFLPVFARFLLFLHEFLAKMQEKTQENLVRLYRCKPEIYSIAYPSEVKTFNAFSKFSSFTRM